jgi:hypothetical protein
MDRKVADTGGKYRCKGAVSKLRSNPGEELRASAASSLVKDKDEEKMFDASSNSGAHHAHPSRFGLATTPLLSMA